jgi:hypothetical protein
VNSKYNSNNNNNNRHEQLPFISNKICSLSILNVLLVVLFLFFFVSPGQGVLSCDNGMLVVGDDLPFLPRVSAIIFSYFIYPFIGYSDFPLTPYVRLLHVILSVVVFPPRVSDINQPKALFGVEVHHIDTYEQMAVRLRGLWEALWGCGDVKELCPSYSLLRPKQLPESFSAHLAGCCTVVCLNHSVLSTGGVL